MRLKDDLRKGQLVAAVLSGAWRSEQLPPLAISEPELDEATPLLCASGAAALGWRRISKTNLRDCPSAEVLHQSYRLQSLQVAIHQEKVGKVFRLLRQASVDALLAKGWAAAGLYSDRDLRPAGDIDICVRPEQFKVAEEVLRGPEAKDCWVDLHHHFYELDDRSLDEIFARAKLGYLGEESIRTPSSEDHLALLCIHFLKHGAWRPLWLCDIAAAIESLPERFDWNLCMGRNKTRAGWIMCAISLAERLLGARAQSLPIEVEARELPVWLVNNVLQQWAHPFPTNQAPMKHPVPMAQLLRKPSGLLEGMRERWPNAIIATVSVDGRFNNFPRFPYQLANCLARMSRLLVQRSGDLRDNNHLA
jgi:hypothetical protein